MPIGHEAKKRAICTCTLELTTLEQLSALDPRISFYPSRTSTSLVTGIARDQHVKALTKIKGAKLAPLFLHG